MSRCLIKNTEGLLQTLTANTISLFIFQVELSKKFKTYVQVQICPFQVRLIFSHLWSYINIINERVKEFD